MQKRQVIDPATLNLDAVQKKFQDAFGEGSTRTDPWRVPEVPRDKLGMMLVMAKLEHQSLKKFLARPDVQAIVNQPGFNRASGKPQTAESREKALKQWWGKNAMPVIKEVAPVLHGLLETPWNRFRTEYYPLSESVQNEEFTE